MADWKTISDVTMPWRNDGTALKAAGSVSADGATTAVTVGKGKFRIIFTLASITTGTGFDVATILIQRNTKNATSTWVNLSPMVFGDSTGVGEGITTAGDYEVIIDNDGDYQLRLYTYLSGSTTAVSYAAKAYPLGDKDS